MARRSAHALVAIAAMLAISLITLGTTPAQAASSGATPKVGQCRTLTAKLAAAPTDTSKPTSCAKRHNAVTIAIAKVPTPLVGQSQEQLSALGEAACAPLVLKKLGRSPAERETSAYRYVFFQPTAAQVQAGARWFRCDLVLEGGKRLLPLPAHLSHPILPKRLNDHIARCLTRTHVTTTCSSTHSYRPIDAITFKPAAYPTADDFAQAGTELCPSRMRWMTWGGAAAWAAGDRVLVCYARTRK